LKTFIRSDILIFLFTRKNPVATKCKGKKEKRNILNEVEIYAHVGNKHINSLQIYYKYEQGNHRYQTSPALCNPTTTFAADRPHHLRPEIFRIVFALVWKTE